MNSKVLIHVCILVVLICWTLIAYNGAKAPDDPKEGANQEEVYDDEEYYDDDYDTAIIEDEDKTADVMMAVAIPMLLIVVQLGFLVMTYVLPSFVDKMSEEMYGSTAEVEDDPLHDARAAMAQGDYHEAIRIFREVFQQNPEDRFPMVEIAKIQRDNLDSPALAVDTLKEALESKEWRENDAAFFMFRIADIYENDMDNHEGAIAILKQVLETLPDTRHSANATHKLRELGAI
ncbi:MAG: tetratricopeptide repeat protein [Verrucomicrobiaceae bacterium]